jgi:hypothetical protein
MNATDHDAFTRALALCRAEDAGRARQIDAKLADEPWEDVARFAASCCQSKSLRLQPWQGVPFRANLRDLDKPFDDPRGERQAAELLQRLLKLGLSRFEPDPIGAIAEAEAKRAKNQPTK